jgi:hypothetical protein
MTALMGRYAHGHRPASGSTGRSHACGDVSEIALKSVWLMIPAIICVGGTIISSASISYAASWSIAPSRSPLMYFGMQAWTRIQHCRRPPRSRPPLPSYSANNLRPQKEGSDTHNLVLSRTHLPAPLFDKKRYPRAGLNDRFLATCKDDVKRAD